MRKFRRKAKKFFKGLLRVLIGLLPVIAVLVIAVQAIKLHVAKKELREDRSIIANYEEQYLNNGQGITYSALEEKLKLLEEKNGSFQEEAEILQERIDQLEQQLADSEATVSSLKEELELRQGEIEQKDIESIGDTTYLSVKFPSDGNFYFNTSDVVFYSDTTCTQKISGQIRFMSKTTDWAYAENGLSICCLRMDNGEICYCTQSPSLVTEKDFWEYYN